MAAEEARLRSLEITKRVQTLINVYNHINNKGWNLDKLLRRMGLTQKMNLLSGWRPEYFEKSTFPTDAVVSRKPEIVVILLFHGADPGQGCPERNSSCAFDDAFTFELSDENPSMRNNLFNIMCALLSTLHGRQARAQQRYADDYLHGVDMDAFSIVCIDGKRTVLMHFVCSNMPFSVRWLICNCNVNIQVKNSENKKMPCSFPCRPTQRNCKSHKTLR